MASKLQKNILDYLKSLPHCWAIKVISANERGCPDILCCYRGQFVAIEVKEGDDKASPIQLAQLVKISKAKGMIIVASGNIGLAQVKLTIDYIDKLRKRNYGKKTEKPVATTKETRVLKCELTEKEVQIAGQELARTLDELESLDDRLKEIKADFKAQIESKEAASKVQRNLVRNKYDYRGVTCTKTMDYKAGSVLVVRDDTDSIVVSRKMSPEERQQTMEFETN